METTGSVKDRAGTRQSTGRDGRPAPAVYRWFVLFLVWGAFLMSCVDRVAWGTIAGPVGNSLGLKVVMLGSFVTAFYIGYVIVNVFGGLVTDAMGARKMLALAMIPLGIATFGFSFTHDLPTGLAIQFVMGLAGGADYSAGVKLILSWFGRERGRALGIYATATSLSVVLTNAAVPRCRPRMAGRTYSRRWAARRSSGASFAPRCCGMVPPRRRRPARSREPRSACCCAIAT